MHETALDQVRANSLAAYLRGIGVVAYTHRVLPTEHFEPCPWCDREDRHLATVGIYSPDDFDECCRCCTVRAATFLADEVGTEAIRVEIRVDGV